MICLTIYALLKVLKQIYWRYLQSLQYGCYLLIIYIFSQVIGLDQNGYGRILGQCQLGAKLFYCMWETIARSEDTFVCCNFIPVDVKELQEKGFEFQTQKDVHLFIKKHIIGKKNEDLVKVDLFSLAKI